MRKLGKRLPSTIWATAAFIASTEDAVVDRPAPAPHGLSEAGPAKGRRAVETPTQGTAGLESRVDLVHSIAADEVVAAVALVVQRGVIEERLHEIEVATEQAAKIVHALEHVSEHAEALAHLSRRQPGAEGAHLLVHVA